MNFAKSNILIERLHSAKSDVSYSISMEFPAFCGTAANSPKRVYVSGLEFHSSEEKSARFTFSRGWAHLAIFKRPPDILSTRSPKRFIRSK